MHARQIFVMILEERRRQEILLQQGKFPFTCSNPLVDDRSKLPVLVEEVGEVAQALATHQSIEELQSELIQVAAVCVAWLEAMMDASVILPFLIEIKELALAPYVLGGVSVGGLHKLPFLMDKTGEVARSISEGRPSEMLKLALAHTADVCVLWLESMS